MALSRRYQLAAVGALCCVGPLAQLLSLRTHHAVNRVVADAIAACFLFGVASFAATVWLVRATKNRFLRRGLGGIDLNKPGDKESKTPIPEALGLATGCVFLIAVVSFQALYAGTFRGRWHRLGDAYEASWQVDCNAGMASICFMILLGFADDVLDVPWRVKILMPIFASLPLLVGYTGSTAVVIPRPLRGLPLPFLGPLGDFFDLGVLYKVAVMLVIVFCTNSINILAGVNGLEVGQTCVLSSAILVFNMTRLAVSPNVASVEGPHMLSIFLVTPLLATSLGLLCLNWYPSQVFVGDTYTYFAGMVLAVAGTLGHFSETLMFFFLPQLINFVYSLPQLLKIVPCPRHRLPKLDPASGILLPTDNYNLVTGFLRWFGPCSELQLTVRLMAFQGACAVFTFALRHALTGWYK